MNRLTKSIIENIPNPVFTVHDLAVLEPSSENIRHALVKRAVADGDLIIIRRGLYALSPLYRKNDINAFSVAQLVYGPSYISLESALSTHGWIPEGVRDIVSVTSRLPKNFDTSINYRLLSSALSQMGPWKNKEIPVDHDWCVQSLKDKIGNINWHSAAEDVRRFVRVREQKSLDLWNYDLFIGQLEKIPRA